MTCVIVKGLVFFYIYSCFLQDGKTWRFTGRYRAWECVGESYCSISTKDVARSEWCPRLIFIPPRYCLSMHEYEGRLTSRLLLQYHFPKTLNLLNSIEPRKIFAVTRRTAEKRMDAVLPTLWALVPIHITVLLVQEGLVTLLLRWE